MAKYNNKLVISNLLSEIVISNLFCNHMISNYVYVPWYRYLSHRKKKHPSLHLWKFQSLIHIFHTFLYMNILVFKNPQPLDFRIPSVGGDWGIKILWNTIKFITMYLYCQKIITTLKINNKLKKI